MVGTGFGCLEKNLQPTDGECEQYIHKFSTYRSCTQHDHISSRVAHGLRIILVSFKTIVIHVSCLTCFRLLPLLFVHLLYTLTQNLWSTMHIWDPVVHDHTATISDRVSVSRRRSLLQIKQLLKVNFTSLQIISTNDMWGLWWLKLGNGCTCEVLKASVFNIFR